MTNYLNKIFDYRIKYNLTQLKNEIKLRNSLSKILLILFSIIFHSNLYAKEIENGESSIIKADQMFYDQEHNILKATGNVKILKDTEYLESEEIILDLNTKKIWINRPFYVENHRQKLVGKSLFIDQRNNLAIVQNPKIGLNETDILVANQLTQTSEHDVEIDKGSFSPCSICLRKKPLWQINAKKTFLDFKNKQIKYQHATFEVAGLKIAYLPFFSHPMRDAEAKSGILTPELYKNSLRIPIYYIVKPNMDLTYTPRISKKVFFHEMEFRHLVNNGRYSLNGSYSKSRFQTKGEGSTNKDKELNRFHFNSKGKFNSDSFYYGYNIEKVSDKSYLKNFYQDNRSFLKSDIFFSKITDSGYIYTDFQIYEGLRLKDNLSTDPQVMPNITIRKDLEIDGNIDLIVKNKTINYAEKARIDVARNSTDITLNKNFYFDNGGIFNLSTTNIVDIYRVRKAAQTNFTIKDKIIVRNSPEMQTGIRLPVNFYTSNYAILIEPQTSLVMGLNNPKNINKYKLVDSANLDFNENNIFENSRYSGIDYRESGTRFTYGLNKILQKDEFQISSFIGQLLKSNSDSVNNRSNYVGKVSVGYDNIFDIYYRFQRLDKNFKPIREEVVANVSIGKLSIVNEFTSLKDIKVNMPHNEYVKDLTYNSINQNYIYSSYQLTKNLTAFGDIRFDMSNSKKSEILSSGIGITYDFDCISFTGRIFNDFTYDPARNIKKSRSYTIKFGLRSINM